MYKDAAIGDTVYFWFAANTTAGAAGDGATPLYDVRLAGAAAAAIPTASGIPTLLTHADYTDGLHEIAIDTTGWAVGEYAVFCTLTISAVNPAGFCGSFRLRAAGASLYEQVVAVKAKTDNLPADPADDSDIDAQLATIAGYLDTEIANIQSRLPDALEGGYIKAQVKGQDNIDFGALQKASLNAATPASIQGNVVGSVASVVADVGITQAGADKVWTTAARALTDKAGFALSATGIDSIWDELVTGHITASSFAKLLIDYLNAEIAAVKTKTDLLKDSWNDISVANIIAGIADGSYDMQEMLRIIFSAIALKTTGGGTATLTSRDSADLKNRIIKTVDANGNTTAVTLDGS